MAEIGFFFLPQCGHLFTSFKLAKSLRERGHRVRYLSSKISMGHITEQGFECLAGFHELESKLMRLIPSNTSFKLVNEILVDCRMEVLKFFKSYRPDLMLVEGLAPAMSLIASWMGIPSLVLHHNLETSWPKYAVDAVLSNPQINRNSNWGASKLPMLILCPKDFDFPNNAVDGRRGYYVESIDLNRAEPPFLWEKVDPNKPIIFCTLGSQGSGFYEKSKSYFQTVMDAMALRPDLQMVLATGPGLNPEELTSVPNNVVVIKWAPQITILKRASLMITHGGLGTIKECIISGVPMIVFPLIREESGNAARVAYHGLGLRGDIRSVSTQQLLFQIQQIQSDPSFKSRVESMRRSFLEFEQAQPGVKIIEKVLTHLQNKHQRNRSLDLQG